MDRDPPNPYRDMTLRELRDAMNERAGELLADGQVSRRDTAYLLLAASFPLATGDCSIGSPAHQVQQGRDIEAAFWPEFESDVRAVMHNTFEHAREAAELTWADLHLYSDAMRDRGTLAGWGVATEQDFRRSLRQLQDLKELKGRGWAP